MRIFLCLFFTVIYVVGTAYAQQPGGIGPYTRENFPTATSSSAKVIRLDMKESSAGEISTDELAKMADFPSTMNHSLPNSPEGMLIGGSVPENPEAARKASPVYYVTGDVVPVFMAHGDRDMLMPFNQSDLVAEALDRADVYYEYYCLLGAGHGGREFWSDELLDKAIAFIRKYTK